MAGVGHALDDGERFQAADGSGSFDQSRRRHHFHFTREMRPPDLQKTVGLIVRRLQKRVDQLQIHDGASPERGLPYESCAAARVRVAFG